MDRSYGAAYPFEDVAEIFLRGVDYQLVPVHSEWLKMSRAASVKTSSESNRLIRLQEAFQELLKYEDCRRHWGAKSPKSKSDKSDRRRDRQKIPHRSHDI